MKQTRNKKHTNLFRRLVFGLKWDVRHTASSRRTLSVKYKRGGHLGRRFRRSDRSSTTPCQLLLLLLLLWLLLQRGRRLQRLMRRICYVTRRSPASRGRTTVQHHRCDSCVISLCARMIRRRWKSVTAWKLIFINYSALWLWLNICLFLDVSRSIEISNFGLLWSNFYGRRERIAKLYN